MAVEAARRCIVALDRRSRRPKTDRIDVEKLLRTLMGSARGERRICAMVRPPSPAEEEARRITRERGTLITERIRHVNRIKGLLATQGVHHFEPLRKDRRERLVELHSRDGRPLPTRLAELIRELDRLELAMSHIVTVEAERDKALQANPAVDTQPSSDNEAGQHLLRLRSIGQSLPRCWR